MNNFEILMSIKWYFEIKNLSLRKILETRTPLSIEQQTELRLYYSQYFTSLFSATELLADEYELFRNTLKQKFVFDSFINGEKNYNYLRELRNSVVHRGMDIASSAHIEDNFPFIVSPIVTNRSGKESYKPFEFYLIDIIRKCELYIPDIILEYLQDLDISEIEETQEELLNKSLENLNNTASSIMPESVKNIAKEAMPKVDFITMRKELIETCLNELKVDFSTFAYRFH